MKRLSVYDVLYTLAHGGYIAEEITAVHERRTYRAYNSLSGSVDCIGYITVGDFDHLLQTDIMDVDHCQSRSDKYGTLHYYYSLNSKIDQNHNLQLVSLNWKTQKPVRR